MKPEPNLNWSMQKFFNKYFFPLLIIGLCVFVAFKNYIPGTWLLGWDDLVPELNFKLNIARSFSSAWQEYQGLGLLGGMAHSADLPRQLLLWISSIIIPTSSLRYFWTFLMLSSGPLGVYMVVSRVFGGRDSGLLGRISAFASAVFYLFNLATLQTFYTPFEAFVSFYGFFPWLLYFALDYLKNGGRKRLLWYCLISLLATGAFYVQTMFVVYAVFLSVFAIETIIRLGKSGMFRSVKLAAVTLFINAFWLLPVLYFSLTSAGVPASSHINSIATPETQLMNFARSDFKDVVTLKGYWFDYYDWGQNGTYDYLYKTWIGYSSQPNVVKVSLALFFVSILGLVVSLFKKKTSYGLSLLALFGISYFMLAGGNIPSIPFFSEIFRNAFTKWANVSAFIYSVGLGLFVYVVSDVIRNKFKYLIGILISLSIVGSSIFTLQPILNGELIAKSMKLNLPSYYLDTISYFKVQDPTKRIASFPITDFWGWKFNDWGYRGSGFLWYGIPQPMLDRTFDVWSPYNEAFYKELSQAVNARNFENLKYVLYKYQVGYILFDGSVFEPGNVDYPAKLQREKDLLESSGVVLKEKEFGKITIYRVDLESVNLFVSTQQTDYNKPFIKTSKKGELAIAETFSDSQGYKTSKNCDLKGQGSVVKNKLEGGNYYAAFDGGSECDYFYYPTLDYSKVYLMRIKGKNLSGRSLKFYLYDVKNKSTDMQELLPTGDFDKSYVILPISKEKSVGKGYTLNVETRSFGKVKSENIVTAIEFYNLNYSYSVPTAISNNLGIKDIQKYGTWAYKVDVQGSGLIQLGQGYDKGWIVFGGNTKLEHIKVNSWANGWNVSEGTKTVYIFFWPQVLEWGGLFLGILTFGYLMIDRRGK